MEYRVFLCFSRFLSRFTPLVMSCLSYPVRSHGILLHYKKDKISVSCCGDHRACTTRGLKHRRGFRVCGMSMDGRKKRYNMKNTPHAHNRFGIYIPESTIVVPGERYYYYYCTHPTSLKTCSRYVWISFFALYCCIPGIPWNRVLISRPPIKLRSVIAMYTPHILR